MLGPEDADISITSFADNARDEGGNGKFVLDTRRGKGAGRGVEVADAARCAEAARKGRIREEATQETPREVQRQNSRSQSMLASFQLLVGRTSRVKLSVTELSLRARREVVESVSLPRAFKPYRPMTIVSS